jgi:hypothetical protein
MSTQPPNETTRQTENGPQDNTRNPTVSTTFEDRPEITTTWGPTLQIPKPPKTMRIIFQNINGVPTDDTLCIELLTSAEALNPSIVGFAETKLDCRKYERTVVPLRSRIQRVWNSSKTIITDSADEIHSNGTFKPGGVMQITVGPTTTRIREATSDKKHGRWTSQLMLHTDGTKSMIYTVYRVCKASIGSAGETTAWKQQWRLHREQGIENPDPRELFLTDLTAEVKERQAQGFEIFIMGDFNTAIDDNRLRNFTHECELFDLHEPCAPSSTAPATYKNGSKKIDHMFGTFFFLEATVNASILSWQDSLPGDHLCLVIDFCENKLNASCNDLTTPGQRKLTSTSPKKANKYRTKLMELMTKSKIAQRLEDLTTKCHRQGNANARDEKKLANIDNEMTGYMIHAEAKCGMTHYGHHYSPTLAKAGQEITRIKKQRKILLLERLNETAAEEQTRKDALELNKTTLKNAWKGLKAAQEISREIRKQHLQERAEWYATQNNTEGRIAVQIIQRAERQKRTFGKIRRHLKPRKNGTIDRILVPNNGTWQEINDANEIYHRLEEQSIKEMSSADGTPFTIPPLSSIIPPWSPSPVNDAILNGTYSPPTQCTTEIRDLFTALIRKDDTEPQTLPTNLTTEQWESSVRVRKESTASSPSGRHIGHYKAALEEQSIMDFHLKIINFAREFTCPPPRWYTGIQLRLEKTTGKPIIDKLRMIQLMEFDMNAQFGTTIGRDMLWLAEDNGFFEGIPQFGSRANRRTQGAALLKRTSYDIMRQSVLDGAICNNDLAKCYDRVHAGIGMIAAQRQGVPKKITDLKLKILERVRIYTRTAHGLSSSVFGNVKSDEVLQHDTSQAPRINFSAEKTRTEKIYGVLQGTQDAGAIWISMWAILYTVLNMISPGLLFHDANYKNSSKRKGEAFVDDADLWVTANTLTDNRTITILQGIQELLQRWYRTLRASGGMLGFEKCYWFLIKFTWKRGKLHMCTATEEPGELTIATDDDRIQTTIQRLEPSHGLRTLGIRIAPDCNQTDEFEHRLQQGKDMAKLIWNAPLSRQESIIAHEQIFWPSIGFPLGITTFNKKQCDAIQTTFQQKFINKMGYSRTMAKAIRHGPTQYGGVGLRTIECEQGRQHTDLLIHHLRAEDEVGDQLRISISLTQLEAGIRSPIFESQWKQHGHYTTETWITKTWEFLSSNGITVHIPEIWTALPQRKNDSFIMELAQKLLPTKSEQKHVQQCRIFLKVTTLSDITEATGQRLDTFVQKGNARARHRTSTLNFPDNFPCPPTYAWSTFRKMLKQLLKDPTDIKSKLLDQYSLGAWYKNRHEKWNTNYSPSTQRIYVRNNNQTTSYARTRANTIFLHSSEQHVTHEPRDTIPISIIRDLTTTGTPTTTERDTQPEEQQPNRINRRNNTRNNTRTNTTETTTIAFDCEHITIPLRSSLRKLPQWQQQYIANLEICENFEKLYVDAFNRSTLRSVSDGSAPFNGSFAWMIVDTEDETTLAQGGGACGNFTGLTSHRMEASGILGCKIFLSTISAHYNITQNYNGTMIHLCDNEEAVNRSNELDLPTITDYTAHDYDIHLAIRKLRNQCPTAVSKWIKGHQDNKTDPTNLPYNVRLNIEADHLCSRHHKQNPPLIQTPPTIQLFKDNTPVTWNMNKFITQESTAEPIITRIMRKHPTWCKTTFESIAWETVGQTMKKLAPHQRTRIVKFQNRISATRKQQQDRDNRVNGRCQNCTRRKNETEDHIIRCPNETITKARDDNMEKLKETLSDFETPPDMKIALLYGIEQWLKMEDFGAQQVIEWPPTAYTYDQTAHKDIQSAFENQNEIGWDELIRGRMSKQWGRIMEKHFRRTQAPKRHNRIAWEQTIVKCMWRLFEATWIARNELEHGANEQETTTKQEEQINKSIQRSYIQDRNNVNNNDGRLFQTPMNVLLQKSLDYKRAWTRSICIAKKQWEIEQGATNPIDPGPTGNNINDE